MNKNIDYGTLPSLYPMDKVKDLNAESDTYLALEIMKLFAQDDPSNFAKVRKQISKSMRVDYFKERVNGN